MTKVATRSIEIIQGDATFTFTGFSSIYSRDLLFDMVNILRTKGYPALMDWVQKMKFMKEDAQVHQAFPQASSEERVINYFSTPNGRLYITNFDNVYFLSNAMAQKGKEMISLKNVIDIQKIPGMILGSSIDITTTEKKHSFKIVGLYAEPCFKYLCQVWENCKKKPRIFGEPLHKIVEREGGQYIPRLLDELVSHIREKSMASQGIFRISASKSQLDQLEYLIDEGNAIDWNSYGDPHLAPGILKKMFRVLPDAIFTEEFYQCFLSVHASKECLTESELIVKYRSLIKLLPAIHRQVGEYIIRFLGEVASHSKENDMDASNLAIVWAPLLFRTPEDASYNIKEAGSTIGLVHVFITHHDAIFNHA
eukprot:TRINITY_DN4270_c0_g1_i1.p1 TRINITY_DN4270_c0_g1~~TRINITY_DN4270_c0_g1_i1.p1  ORF type:complete len:366 (-),score=99.63 TRINITY_DN4270_c0_g1_i1:26-1123(-)